MRLFEKLIRGNWYVAFVLITWIFAPELRRIADWLTTFHAVSIFGVIPFIVLLPGLYVMRKDWAELGPDFHRVVRFWMIGYGLAYVISLLGFGILSGTYGLVTFCLPIAFAALYAASRTKDPLQLYNRCADALLFSMCISALYAIYQYADPPPWDTYWAANEDIEAAQGATVAFGFRVFGTLNSTGPFANALMLALLFYLPRFSLKRWPGILASIPIVVALTLTTVRSDWIGLGIGVLVYFFLAASRVRLISALGLAALVFALSAAVIGNVVKDSEISFSAISDRLATFSDLANDNSVQGRQQQTAVAVDAAISTPTGIGLGKIGAAGRLSSSGWFILDNGYASRFLELGYIGFGLFLVALGTAVFSAFKSYRLARTRNDAEGINLLAVAIAAQIAMLFLEAGADTHLLFLGMFFWVSVQMASGYAYEHSPRVTSRMRASAGSRRSSSPTSGYSI